MDFLLNEEQKELRNYVRKVAEEKVAPVAERDDLFEEESKEELEILAEAGLLEYIVPKEYGGKGVSCVNICIIREELCRISDRAGGLFVEQGLGSYPIAMCGTEEQKKKYLAPIAKGEKFPAFGVSEPDAGSDIGGIKTTAVLDGDEWVLNGYKIWINPSADIYTVFAKTDPALRSKGISAFIVEKGTPGFEPSRRLSFLAPFWRGEMKLDNCRIPKENLFGEVGGGMKIALTNLNIFRTSVGAGAVGLAQRAYEEAVKYARKRVAFGQPISQFQAIQFKLADMATKIHAARLMVYHAARLIDSGAKEVIKEASMAKLFATEAAQSVVDEALQIHGAAGLIKGMPIELLYRQVRICTIVEGTSEIQRITIARQILREAETWS